MTVEIRPGCLRDVSYVMANLRKEDREEAYCQLPDGVQNWQLAHMMLMAGDCFVAFENDQPVMAFGTSPMTGVLVSVWALGTDRASRVIPAVTDYLATVHVPDLIERGFLYMEARSIVTHKTAHRWMEMTGAKRLGPAHTYGKNGELFYLFRWTVSGYRAIRPNMRRWNR